MKDFQKTKQLPKRLIITASFASILLGLMPATASHATPAGWDAGRIIDPGVFTNKNSMSAQDIQNFLNSKVPECDNYGQQTSEYGGPDLNGDGKVQRWEWGQANYNQSVFHCLKGASENGISAAQIIYNTAQKYTINPQVLIVLLQKEQGLVTDTWPLNVQYRTATGYGCPDTAPCDSQYYGLTNQLDWSGKMFRSIMDASPTWYTPYMLGTNFIQYSPDKNCGGSNVNIQNRSTQALYNYTPYQPNQAALDAGFGAVSCGAYGNRNFYLYFTSWFGTTKDPTYAWVNMGVGVYTDATKTTRANLSQVSTGSKLYVVVNARNTGNVTWFNGGNYPVRLGTWGAQDRMSSFCEATWYGCNRAALLRESSVPPGQIGSFEFWVTIPNNTTADYKFEGFNPVAENAEWFNGDGFQLSFTVIPTLSAATTARDAYLDSTKSTLISTGSLVTNQRFYMVIKAKNTGNITWTNSGSNPVKIGNLSPFDSASPFCDSSWSACNRIATLTEASVAPGATGTFEFWQKTPASTGFTTLWYNFLSEGNSWFRSSTFYLNNVISTPAYRWQLVNQQAFSDSSYTTPMPAGTLNLTPGQKVYIRITAKNTGNVIWQNSGSNPTRLGTWNRPDHTSPFCDGAWVACNRPAAIKESAVSPGQTGTFEFTITGPNYRGNHLEFYNMLTESKSWFNDTGLYYRVVD